MYKLSKFLLDKVIATFGIVFMMPLFIAISVVIKLSSPGPIFIRQRRVGKNGKIFSYLKFRTMLDSLDPDFEQAYAEKLVSGEFGTLGEDTAGRPDIDPRITKFGAFLRLTRIDELPAFINLFKGDISLVGPRPSMYYELMSYDDWHSKRLEVKPGITGLWQVTKGARCFDEMVKLDLEYIEKRSFFLDIRILLKTVILIMLKQGAY